MSTTLLTIKNSGKEKVDLSITQFAGPNGVMLQLTQGFGGCSSMRQLDRDEPGFVQLTVDDAEKLVKLINKWLLDV